MLGESGGLVFDAKFIIQVSKGLIRNARARRTLMFYSVLIALVLLFAGATVLWPFLRESPLIFIGYWLVCGWITLLAVLLSLYDMVKVRAEVRQARRALEREHFEKGANDQNPR